MPVNDRTPALSTSDRVVDGRANSSHYLVGNTTEWSGERALKNGVKTITIDDRRLVDACVIVVKIDLRRKTPH